MIRIGVIEDEARMREEVCRYVEKTAGDFAEIQCRAYESAERFLEENSEYEILILDIRLPGINGIELGRILRERGKDTKLLYLTSYAEYAAESYLVEASQYILKESMDRRLPDILQRMISEEIEQKKDYRIVGIKQDQRAKAKPIDWYMMTKEPYLHIGQPLVAYNAYEYRTYYPMRYIVGEETSSLIGCFRQGRYENLIVFSDTYFEKVKDYWKTTDMNTGEPVEPDEAVLENTIHEGPTVLALVNLPESAVREQEERADQIMAEFQEAHAYDESFDPLVKSAYSKKEAVTRRQMEHILETVMNGFVLVMLLTAGILMLHMKVNMELPEIKTRYQFMECFGMRRAERVRNMKKEVSRFVWIPLGTGAVISMVFTGIVWGLRDFQMDDIRRYVLWQGLIWMIYAIIQIGNMKWLQRMVIKLK